MYLKSRFARLSQALVRKKHALHAYFVPRLEKARFFAYGGTFYGSIIRRACCVSGRICPVTTEYLYYVSLLKHLVTLPCRLANRHYHMAVEFTIESLFLDGAMDRKPARSVISGASDRTKRPFSTNTAAKHLLNE